MVSVGAVSVTGSAGGVLVVVSVGAVSVTRSAGGVLVVVSVGVVSVTESAGGVLVVVSVGAVSVTGSAGGVLVVVSVGAVSVTGSAGEAMVVGNKVESVADVFPTGISARLVTFTMTEVAILPAEALITAVPGDTPIMLPVPSTCAIFASLLVQTRGGLSIVSIGE